MGAERTRLNHAIEPVPEARRGLPGGHWSRIAAHPTGCFRQHGQPLSAFDIFVARTLGAILVTLGIIDWSVSNLDQKALQGVLWANVFMNVTLGAIDTANILDGTIGPANWSGIGFHVLFTTLFLVYLLRSRDARAARPDGQPRPEVLRG